MLILITKSEVSLVELQKPHGLAIKASINQSEIEDEVHEVVVTVSPGSKTCPSYIEILILHDSFMLLKLVLNSQTLKFH